MSRPACLSVLVLLLSAPGAAAQGTIDWVNNYEEGMRQALETNRAVMLDFWAAWCRPCVDMDREVYPVPAVAGMSRRFVFVRLDFDRQKDLADRYRVYGIPMMVFTDPAGNILASHVGYASASRLLGTMERIPESFEAVRAPMRVLAEDPSDFGALIQAARFYLSKGLVLAAKDLYLRAGRTPAAHAGLPRDQVQMGLGVAALTMKDGKEAEKIFQKALKQCDPASREVLLLGLVRAHVQRSRAREAQAVANELAQKHPGSPTAAKAREVVDTMQWNR